MPTASIEMTNKLVKDFAAVEDALKALQEHRKSAEDAPSAALIEKQQDIYDRITAQIEKFESGVKKKPLELPDEKAYRDRRKDVTTLLADVASVEKVVAKEEAATDKEVKVKAVSAAKNELLGKDAKLAQALTKVARGEKGRTGPKQDGVEQYNHIHIGGNANKNLLFQPGNKLVLGVLEFHLEKGLSDSNKHKIKTVAARSGSAITLRISGDEVLE